MMEAILFAKCLGLNDARAFGTQKANPRSGFTELIDCLNITTTPDGCIEKIPHLETVLTHSATITNISAKNRFIYQDGTDTKEWDGTNVSVIGAILNGPVAHTPIDVRISHNDAGTPSVYKSATTGVAVSSATVGTNPNPATSKPFYAMPAFDGAFVYNAKLYGINHEDPRFLQYSEDYHYDLYALGDNHIGHIEPLLQAGAIPGQLITTQAEGVNVYEGTSPVDFRKRFYPCNVIDKTLFSGFLPGQNRDRHVFLCDDGVYMIAQIGDLTNLTAGQTDNLKDLNATYYGTTIHGSKYLAFGDLCTLEYDFQTKTLLKRASFGITAATVWSNTAYVSTGMTVATMGTAIDTTANFVASLTLPYSDLGAPGTKSIESLYFTGTIDGDVTITATDQTEKFWEVEVSQEWVNVSNKRIKTPKGMLGNHISFKIECTSGAFRLEELKASLSATKRSR